MIFFLLKIQVSFLQNPFNYSMPINAGMLQDNVFWSCGCMFMSMLYILTENGGFKTYLYIL